MLYSLCYSHFFSCCNFDCINLKLANSIWLVKCLSSKYHFGVHCAGANVNGSASCQKLQETVLQKYLVKQVLDPSFHMDHRTTLTVNTKKEIPYSLYPIFNITNSLLDHVESENLWRPI